MNDARLPNGSSGRDASGRFTPGNAIGPGNPFGGRIEQFRAALFRAVTPDDIEALAKKLVAMGRKGNVAAIQEILNRLLGKPRQTVELHDHEPLISAEDTKAKLRVLLAQPEARRMIQDALAETD